MPRVREESHLDDMRAAIRGDFERLARRRGGQELMQQPSLESELVEEQSEERSLEPETVEASSVSAAVLVEPVPGPDPELEPAAGDLQPEAAALEEPEQEPEQEPQRRGFFARLLGL